ncbi:MAG: multiheme c-type cytochrome [Isosphaeraceae bacterium]
MISPQEARKIERFVVDYALGSGHHATTFVTVLDLDPPKILEHRLTYYTREGTLEVTPGQAVGKEMPGTTPAGREVRARETLKCFGCHATQLSAHSVVELDPLLMIPSVTCERCHGPGRAHVEAARRGAGAEDLSMPMGLEGWTVQSQLELCGGCHRHPSRVPPEQLNANDPALARFQPIGLSQSRCFKESEGRLSCVSCHDPHARSSSDPAIYERVCLSCHEMPRKVTTGETGHEMSHLAATSVCPVSPTRGCVACHMPGVDSGQYVLFTDHWIGVRRPAPGM